MCTRKRVEVVAAIIQSGQNILATQRGYGDFKDGWEFPGGKIEAGETPDQALKREIKEELDADINVGDLLITVNHSYEKFDLVMHCFMCSLVNDDFTLLEHEAAKWLTKDTLYSVDWLAADITVVDKLNTII